MPKKIVFHVCAIALMLALAYAVLEVVVRTWHGSKKDRYAELRAAGLKARAQGLSLPAYGETLPQHPVLGWDENPVIYAPAGNPNPFVILLIGDSISAGLGVQVGAEDYASHLCRRLGPARVKVINAAVNGYGIDQMLLKAVEAVKIYRPNLLIFSYIPHDLLRAGTGYLWGRPKPRLHCEGDELVVECPPAPAAFYAAYDRARRHGALWPWYVRQMLASKEYYLPGKYADYYGNVFRRVYRELARTAGLDDLDVLIVKLTSLYVADKTAALAPLAQAAFTPQEPSPRVYFLNTDAGMQQRLAAAHQTLEQVFTTHHPGPDAHRYYAECLADFIAQHRLAPVEPATAESVAP
jgi:hypothetical protein